MITEAHPSIDILWVLLCACLVVAMQAGFTCVESGLVRAKNSINVAFKNLIDFCISCALFAIAGFGIMFGPSIGGWMGWQPAALLDKPDTWLLAFFFFQAAFCGTATTIVSGAVAERMRFSAYCATSAITSLLIYPIAGHWAWGGALEGKSTGWLGQMGFIDFAGSTVVHSVGGWASLAAILIIGPRLGRFGPGGRAVEGGNIPMATLGVFLLWVSWFGFNGGSTLALDQRVPGIIVNTALAGATGGLGALALTWMMEGRPLVDRVMNGVLAGLVSITAGCHLVTPVAALAIGAIGGLLCVLGMRLLERLRIDDAVGAVPVHLFAGIWGTLAVALFAAEGSWGPGLTRQELFGIQLLGVASVGAYAFGASFLLFKLVDRVLTLRVTANDERIGLNIAEHGAGSAVLDLILQMDRQAREGDFARRVEVEPETEAARIAMFYNGVLDKVQLQNDRSDMALKKVAQLANYDTLTGLGNRRVCFEAIKRAVSRTSRSGKHAAVLYIDFDDFKGINDRFGHEAGDFVLREAARRMSRSVRDIDVVARLGGDEFAVILEGFDAPGEVKPIAEKLLAAVGEPVPWGELQLRIGASIGIAVVEPGSNDDPSAVLRRADHAMYTAKVGGKGAASVHGEIRDDFMPAP
jgi:Amt family ammonium transporter